MPKVSLAEFQKYFLKLCFAESEYSDDNWYYELVNVDELYILHPDFRTFPITKKKKMIDEVKRFKPEIDADKFPFSKDIKKNFDKKPIIILQDKEGKNGVLDGQKRAITACYHKEKQIKAYVHLWKIKEISGLSPGTTTKD